MPHGDIIINQPELLTKLEIAFSMGCTDVEACLFAGISGRTLYAYIEQVPSFTDRKEKLKQYPILKARTNVVSKLDDDVSTAKWYLERKTQEFKPPDRNTNIQLNQLHILTEPQLRDRVAHKLSKLLTVHNDPMDDNDNVTDADIVEDTSNIGALD